MAKLILGVDPGTRITGYGLIRVVNNRLEPIDFGCIRPPATLPLEQRYKIIFEAIEQLIEKYQPDAIAVESQFVLKNPQSAIKLGMAKGMILLAAARRNIGVFEYAPKKAKMAVVGNGNASKTQVQRMIASILRLPSLPEPEDAADALALAICHANNKESFICSNTSKALLSIKTSKKRWSRRVVSGIDLPFLSAPTPGSPH
jgi:crossover junction endodeoxyribonuclease RuvC